MAKKLVGGWQVEGVSRNVMSLRHYHKSKVTIGASPLLLVGDAHWDNTDCDRDRLAADLDEAKERDSPILIGGDFFCAMQGKYDKRSSKSKIRPEHMNGDYLDSLVYTAAEWLAPWKDNIVLIGVGNHESSIHRIHETNLTMRLAAELRRMGSQVQAGGYRGWVRLKLDVGRVRKSFRMHYMHGHGGGGPVTLGRIDFNRYAVQTEYDVMWAQHVHHTEVFDTMVAALNEKDQPIQKSKWHIRTPSYKDEFQDGFGGFQVERGQGPRPKGGVWLSVYKIKGHRPEFALHAERTRA